MTAPKAPYFPPFMTGAKDEEQEGVEEVRKQRSRESLLSVLGSAAEGAAEDHIRSGGLRRRRVVVVGGGEGVAADW